MLIVRCALLLVPLLALAACGGTGPTGSRPVRAGCEEAAGQGVAPGRSSARLVAQASLSYQAQDLRGYMAKDGYRAVQQRVARIDCRPYALGMGLTHCVARAQLCGH